jgi:hypothetical protein
MPRERKLGEGRPGAPRPAPGRLPQHWWRLRPQKLRRARRGDVTLAKKLRRYPVNGRKRSLREIAVELEAQGYVNERSKVFNPKPIASMLGRIAS